MAHEVKGGWNQIVYCSRLLYWKNQTLAPNPDAINRRFAISPVAQDSRRVEA